MTDNGDDQSLKNEDGDDGDQDDVDDEDDDDGDFDIEQDDSEKNDQLDEAGPQSNQNPIKSGNNQRPSMDGLGNNQRPSMDGLGNNQRPSMDNHPNQHQHPTSNFQGYPGETKNEDNQNPNPVPPPYHQIRPQMRGIGIGGIGIPFGGGPSGFRGIPGNNIPLRGPPMPFQTMGYPPQFHPKDQNFDLPQNTSISEAPGNKRKREDNEDSDDEEDNDSQESKKLKTNEPGMENKGEFQYDQGNQNYMPFPPQSGVPPMYRGGGPGMFYNPYMGGPKSFPMPGMPGENHFQQIPFGNPQQMMGFQKQENYVEVEPYFQQFLLKTPPNESLTEKLPSSKTPVIDAFIYCAICNWGVSISPTQDRLPTTFTITDFNKYWECSQKICSKPSPTETPVARLKALRRWFADFPGIKKIKAVKEGKEPIMIIVKQDRIVDVIAIVKKYSQIINTRCRSLVQGTINHQPSFNTMENNNDFQ